MKLQELAKEPKLKEVVIDKPELVEKYGETITFFILDRLPIDTFTKLATIKQDDIQEMYSVMEDLVLNEKGMPIMTENKILPVDILTECILKVTEDLGKSVG
tara:strand:+ start:55 stop:360 length:306 start_codon:yes stop_codon:yes gene_type:complete